MRRAWRIFGDGSKRGIPRGFSHLRSSRVLEEEEAFDEERLKMTEEIVESRTEISRDHLTPEIGLRLLTPNCPLYHEEAHREDSGWEDWDLSSRGNLEKRIFRDPFWSIYWPGGQALTRFVLDHGPELLNKSKGPATSFLDVGAGCGASSIAAKIIGAGRVIANDVDQVACVAAKSNARLNKVDIEVSSRNLLEDGEARYKSRADVILVGDLLYEDETAEALIPWLEEAALRYGSRIYLGDPGRHALTEPLKARMKLRRSYSLPENVRRENYPFRVANVWQLNLR